MSWRTVIVTGIAKLDYKMDYLVVRKTSGISRIYIGEIGMLIIESTAISLTALLLCELVKHKVKVIFCDEKHNPQSELMAYYGSHDTSQKVKNQVRWSDATKKVVWTEIVSEKIRKQMQFLVEKNCISQAKLLAQYISDIQLGDETNREGHAAKVYFNCIFGMNFTRTEDNPVNAALNYGYGIILSHFNREVVSCGYITQLGLFHDNMFNQFNLASDLMEPFRVLVDRKVCKLNLEKFDAKEKKELIFLLNEEITVDGKNHTVGNGIRIYCRSVFDALNEKDVSLIRFYGNEL